MHEVDRNAGIQILRENGELALDSLQVPARRILMRVSVRRHLPAQYGCCGHRTFTALPLKCPESPRCIVSNETIHRGGLQRQPSSSNLSVVAVLAPRNGHSYRQRRTNISSWDRSRLAIPAHPVVQTAGKSNLADYCWSVQIGALEPQRFLVSQFSIGV